MGSEGRPRAAAKRVSDFIAALGTDELRNRQRAAVGEIRVEGITFTVASEHGNLDREWPFDVIPRVMGADEWDGIERGLTQRLTALNCFIDDLYGEQRAVKAGVLPREVLATSALFSRGVPGHAARATASGRTSAAATSCATPTAPSTCSRTTCASPRACRTCSKTGTDQARVPASCSATRASSRWTTTRAACTTLLASLAPEQCAIRRSWCSRPACYNSAYFEHCYLAQQMGVELVEGRT